MSEIAAESRAYYVFGRRHLLAQYFHPLYKYWTGNPGNLIGYTVPLDEHIYREAADFVPRRIRWSSTSDGRDEVTTEIEASTPGQWLPQSRVVAGAHGEVIEGG